MNNIMKMKRRKYLVQREEKEKGNIILGGNIFQSGEQYLEKEKEGWGEAGYVVDRTRGHWRAVN